MNPLNYATLEASKRLVDAGIVLETEKVWVQIPNLYVTNPDGSSPLRWECRDKAYGSYKDFIPAPSMAEVWRELPDTTQIILIKRGVFHVVHYASNAIYTRKNPTDALIELLIHIKNMEAYLIGQGMKGANHD